MDDELMPIYVASRASVPERGEMWRRFRDQGIPITSSWIDEDGAGQTADFRELWDRISREIAQSVALVLYAEASDFPLKGALVEAGMALGMNKRVVVCLPDVALNPWLRPIGSWLKHPNVAFIPDINEAVKWATNPAF